METLQGIAVFPGVAIGPALVLDRDGLRVPRFTVSAADAAAEVARLDAAIAAVAAGISRDASAVSAELGAEVASIFQAHRLLVSDPSLREQMAQRITADHLSAENAVDKVLERYAATFRQMAGSHFAERASDFVDIKRRLLKELLGDPRDRLAHLDHEVVVLAHDLTPSETANFDPRRVLGLCTETGGKTSHTSIIAGAMEIPAVVGLGALPPVADGETVIIDGHRGVVVLRPDDVTLRRYRSSRQAAQADALELERLRDLPAETPDGVRVRLFGNIEFPHEAEHCLEKGAEGIGLYRTEFLYLNRATPPTEEDHYAAYARVVRAMGPHRPVTLRTLDLGADKLFDAMPGHAGGRRPHEQNPVLGLRSVRLSFKHPQVFKTQLRAILRASVLGDVRIMFPLVSTLRELRRCRLMLGDVMEDLEEAGVPFRRDIPVGMMVEVPSAALLAEQFARDVDFFSIGTNDLIQYTLAVDRTNETVAPLYSGSDPAVLRLVRHVVLAARRHGVKVTVCGAMSSDPIYAPLLMGLGVKLLSLTPHSIPEVKRVVRRVPHLDARHIAQRVLRLDNAADITKFLRSRLYAAALETADDR